MTARQPAKEPPERKLIAAARKAIEEHGYAGLTLERIAAEAEVSRVTLHRRGHSKDEIFNALIVQVREEHRDALWPALTASGDGADRLRMAVAKICDMCERDLLVMLAMRAHLDAAAHGALAPEPQTNWIVAEPLQVLARDGIADGSLRDGDPETVGAVLVNWAGWTYVHMRTAFDWKPRRARAVVVEQVVGALRASS
ncbi:MAG TPA: TetR/AcrR family transcriptional regulator [Solirubrobacterales bacterium]|jgi:AcrR family transcriptional regulator